MLVHFGGDGGRGRALCEEALALVRARGDHRGIALALLTLGAIVHDEGNARAALPVLEEATTLWPGVGRSGG